MPEPKLPVQLVCPECLGRDFSKHQEQQEHRFLFFSRMDAYERHECDGCGFSFVVR